MNHTFKNTDFHTVYILFVKTSLLIYLLLSQYAVAKYEVSCELNERVEIHTYTYNNGNNTCNATNEPSSKIDEGINAWLANNTTSNNNVEDNSLFRIIVPTKNLDLTEQDDNPSPFWINDTTSDTDVSEYTYWPYLHKLFFPKQGSSVNELDGYTSLTQRFHKLWSTVTDSQLHSASSMIPPIYQGDQINGYLPITPSVAHLRQEERVSQLQYIVPEKMVRTKAVLKLQLWLTKTDDCPSGCKFCASHFQWTLFPYMDPTKVMYEEALYQKALRIKCRRLYADIHFLCIVPTTIVAKEIKDIVLAEAQTSVPIKRMSDSIKKDAKEVDVKGMGLNKIIGKADNMTKAGDLQRLTLSILVVESNDAAGNVSGEPSSQPRHSRRKDRFKYKEN
ncbi:MAG: hypothetical protein QS721_01820 [Candidatus Endonucleobacter sp. (ex Gigantidas childressi)]|nr:hypothetical protein [Candidatus Endonucleobacter sp. (ex Gigantidas childressi)]